MRPIIVDTSLPPPPPPPQPPETAAALSPPPIQLEPQVTASQVPASNGVPPIPPAPPITQAPPILPPPPQPVIQQAPLTSLEGLLGRVAGEYAPKLIPGTQQPGTQMETVAGSGLELDLSKCDGITLATVKPPQTLLKPVKPTCGAHCLVIDVSFSMETAATVTSDDGDKVDHGFSVLDIAKHAMCTYVTSLDDADWACVACYASDARMVIEWTQCTHEGKQLLYGAIRALVEEGSTNLTGGIGVGMRAFEELPPPVAANPSAYALLLAVATDGQPSSGTHPPAGASYASFVKEKSMAVSTKYGPAAVPAVVAIGLGNDLDSRLLHSFSDTFLHIPDPGSVGPFMVHLLASTRCTAQLEVASSVVTANRAILRLSPASAISSVPGHPSVICGDEVLVTLSSLLYDQPRHVVVLTTSKEASISGRVSIEDVTVASCQSPVCVGEAGGASAAVFEAEIQRTAAVCALQLQEQRITALTPKDEVAARLAREGARIGDVTISLVWNDEADLDLHVFLPSGEEISYNSKKSACGTAELDVDMNASTPFSKEPVENVYVGDIEKGVEAPKGTYRVVVENYAFHGEGSEPRDVEFKVQVRMHGDQTTDFTGTIKRAKERVTVTEFAYTGRTGEASGGLAETLKEQRRQMDAEKARLRAVPQDLLETTVSLLKDGPLKTTLNDEALLAIQPQKFKTWGKHYLVTFPQMLSLERRSNFRDAALQDFGRDADGRAAFFEDLSTQAEMSFAQLEPPKPSGLERLARQAAAAARAPPRAMTAMPDEFMRGGGCFAPCALVTCVGSEGGNYIVPISRVAAGTIVRTGSGETAVVRCVVESRCSGGRAVLTAMPSGLEITEWHPVLDASMRWHFPNMIGRQVVRRCDSVFNLVLDREHVAIVGNMPCATLGHGIQGPVIGHPFWGGSAVIEQLASEPGWSTGHVVLPVPLRPVSAID